MPKIKIENAWRGASGCVVFKRRKPVADYLAERRCDGLEHILAWLNENCDRIGLLKSIYIDDEERGNGCGTELLTEFIESAECLGAEAILLIADTGEAQYDGFDLVEWYERHGFVSISGTEFGPLMVYPSDIGERLADSFD